MISVGRNCPGRAHPLKQPKTIPHPGSGRCRAMVPSYPTGLSSNSVSYARVTYVAQLHLSVLVCHSCDRVDPSRGRVSIAILPTPFFVAYSRSTCALTLSSNSVTRAPGVTYCARETYAAQLHLGFQCTRVPLVRSSGPTLCVRIHRYPADALHCSMQSIATLGGRLIRTTSPVCDVCKELAGSLLSWPVHWSVGPTGPSAPAPHTRGALTLDCP